MAADVAVAAAGDDAAAGAGGVSVGAAVVIGVGAVDIGAGVAAGIAAGSGAAVTGKQLHSLESLRIVRWFDSADNLCEMMFAG